MFGSEILEVAISLIFVYILLSLVCTAFNEWVARMLALRANTLKAGIRNLLDDKGEKDSNTNKTVFKMTEEFYSHPLIKGLYKQGLVDGILNRGGGPSYISARTFALALMDILVPDDQNGKRQPLEEIKNTIETLEPEELRKALLPLYDVANKKLDAFQKNIETWFDESMKRVTGWYTRKAAIITICFALVLTVATNADTIMMAKQFSGDNALRDAVVESAGEMVTTEKQPDMTLEQIKATADELELPLGWNREPLPETAYEWLLKIIGLFITALAIAMGAPFWFDVLGKLVNLRKTGKAETEKTPSETPAEIVLRGTGT
jgi:hypothetical protein